jgi:hypothetical protein
MRMQLRAAIRVVGSLALQLAEIVAQSVESVFPKPAILLDVVSDVLERRGFEPTRAPLRFASASDETRVAEYLEVARDGGKRHREWR